jgi:hypothetical protein
MTNGTIGFPVWTGLATPAAGSGSWLAGWPIANIKSLPLGRVARSSSAAATDTRFEVTFATETPVQMFTFVNHNASNDGTFRIRAYADLAATDLLYDSGPGPSGAGLEFWPAVYQTEDLEWEDDRWWDGKYSDQEKLGNVPILPVLAPQPMGARLIRVEVTDPLNPAGFFQLGYFDLAGAYAPGVNFKKGSEYGLRDRTVVLEAEGGAKYFNRRGDVKFFRGSIDCLPRGEARVRFFEMHRQLGVALPFVWLPFPDQPETYLTQAFLARHAALDPITLAYVDRDTVPLNFEEVR